MASSQFTYFTFLLMFVLLLYCLVLSVFLCIRRTEVKRRIDEEPLAQRLAADEDNNMTFTWTTSVTDVTNTSCGDRVRPLLLIVRLIGFVFILISAIGISASFDPSAFYYFDGWAIILTFFYYFFSCIMTAAAVNADRYRTIDNQRLHWTYKFRLSAVITHMLFEVSGASIVASVFINMQALQTKSVILYNQTLAVFGLLVLDMMFNEIRVRFDQMPASIAWLVFYFICIWPAVFTGSMMNWPYPAMSTEKATCFVSYTVMVCGMMISYTLWYALYKLKKILMHFYFVYRDRDQHATEEAVALAEISMAEQDADQEESDVQNAMHGSTGGQYTQNYDPNYYNQYGYGAYSQDPYQSQYGFYGDPNGMSTSQYPYAPGSYPPPYPPPNAAYPNAPYPPQPYPYGQYDPQSEANTQSYYSNQSGSSYGQLMGEGAGEPAGQSSAPAPYYPGYPPGAYPPPPPPPGAYYSGYGPPPGGDMMPPPPHQPYHSYPPPPLQVSSPTGQPTPNQTPQPASNNQTNPASRPRGANPLHRRRPSPGNNANNNNNGSTNHAPPARPNMMQRTPTAMFGNNDADISAYAFGFNDF